MIDYSPLRWALLIGGAAFLCGGAIAYLRLSLTKYHIPTIVLILVAVSGGLAGIVAGPLIMWDSENIDSTVSSDDEFSELVEYAEVELPPDPVYSQLPPELQAVYTNYHHLSPEAQELFRTALKANGTHTTRSYPSELSIRSDGGEANQIYYNSEPYILISESRGGFGTFFAVMFVMGLGCFLLMLGVVAAAVYPGFKLSLSVIIGVASGCVCVISGITRWKAVSILLGIAILGVLRGIERYYQISFRERMET